MANMFNNRGNHFFIEVIPDINNKGEWQGQYQLAIEQVCQMACASLALMEEDPSYRKKVYDYLHSPDDSSEVNGKAKTTIDKITDNVITVNFKDDT